MTLPCGHEPEDHFDPDVHETYRVLTGAFLALVQAVDHDSSDECLQALSTLHMACEVLMLHVFAGGDLPPVVGQLLVEPLNAHLN